MMKDFKKSNPRELVRRLSSSIASVNIKKRDSWVGKFDFLLSCIGYAVGLGTIWRFPYVCYRNGGGAFLIPYVLYMLLLGMPLVIMEMGFGQFASLSPISIWRVSPIFKGVGLGMVIVSGITCVYYNVIIAWTLYYFYHSFSWTLPWKTCGNPWNTPSCITRWKDDNTTFINISNISNPRTASEEFWSFKVLNISPGIDDPGSPQWDLTLCLVIAWIFIFLCLYRGVKTSGKVVYVTATLPYVLLFIFIVKGLTMDGAIDGIKFYVVPKWHHLLRFQPWAEAAQQMFYSMGVAWGAWITMASYNKFDNNFYRDAIIVSLIDTLTAFLSGFVIFSTIGYMARQTGLRVEDVVVQGPGLVFIVLPEAISSMPFAPVWAILFFVFIFFVGVDSQFGMFETVLSGIFDEFPFLSRRKYIFTGMLCFVELMFGIACVTRGGIYVFQILDWYCSTFSLMILSFLECIAIAWIYGCSNFYHDMTLMLGWTPTRWWCYSWKFITPVLILFLFITNVVMHTPVSYGKYKYPTWAILLGLVFSLSSILPIPVIAICQILKVKGPLLERIKEVSKPTRDWGPADRTRIDSLRLNKSSKIAAEIVEISSDTANLKDATADAKETA